MHHQIVPVQLPEPVLAAHRDRLSELPWKAPRPGGPLDNLTILLSSRFSRSVALPEGVTEEDVRARYENGILEVVVPGAAKLSGVRRIPIEVGGRR